MIKCPQCGRENPQDSKFCNDCGASLTGEGTGKLNPDTVLEGRYIIVKTIGRGGMGAVYLALDSRLNHMPVAMKEMSTQAVGGDLQAAIASFQKEASLLTSLRHPSLPVIRDFFSRSENRWYLVMDYIEGQTLKQFVDQNGPVPEAQVLDWARQLCGIFEYLHNQNPSIIFRDLKPSNIILTPQGQIKLIDFGIARHFNQLGNIDTSALGSEGFAPPEQYGDNQTDPRADIYALGATLHYLLTGNQLIQNRFQFEAPSRYIQVSPQMDQAIMKALELSPENRPQDVRELLSMLPQGAYHTHTPVQSSPVEKNTENSTPETAPLPKSSPVVSSTEAKTSPMTAPGSVESSNILPVTEPLQYDTVGKIETKPSLPSDTTNKSNVSAKPKRKNRYAVLAVLILVLLVPIGIVSNQMKNTQVFNNSEAEVIVFNDPALEKAIREEINKPTGQITKEDVETVTYLHLSDRGIRDVSGLEYFTDLQELYLEYNQISNIEALRGLTSLEMLCLWDNQISDVEALGGLTNLTNVDLSLNQISDIEILGDLANLQELDLEGNQVSDIEALRGLTNLQYLDLSFNQISDVSPLQNLTNLYTLFLEGNDISDYSPVTSYYQNIRQRDFEL